ncbi:MAG: hypothetical protein ABIP55_02205 [Tepidisphaeraceae bacterium]
MRMAIGLAALLVCIGVIVWIMSAAILPATKTALDTKKRVQPKVEQVAGHSADGTRAADTIKVDAESKGGRMTSLLVTEITPGGVMEKYFGLVRGDSIMEIAPQGGAFQPVKEMASPQEAKDYLTQAYQNSQQIIVMREGQKLTLPATPAPGAKPTPAASGNPLSKQLEWIQKVPSH